MIRRVAAACIGAAIVSMPVLAGDLKSFQSKEWGIEISYPPDLVASDTFKANFMDRGGWRVSYAADIGPGARILALSLPDLDVDDEGGASKATAELRIGASRDPDVVATCLAYGMNSGNNVETRTKRIGGVDFREVPDNSDGEMSKMIRSDDLRAVHGGACYAIDLVLYVEGTSNRRPEYADDQVEKLRSVLANIRFD